MTKDFNKFTGRKSLHETMDEAVSSAKRSIEKIKSKVENLEVEKPHITAEERQDVTDRAVELARWLDEQVEKQSKLEKSVDPVFDPAELAKKLKKLQ